MKDYPADAGARALLRERLIAEGRRRGEAMAQRQLRSMNCATRFEASGDDHAPCRNDGTGCLCPCHDRVPAENR